MRPAIVKFFDQLIGTGFIVPDYAFMQTVAILFGIFIVIKEAEKKRTGLKESFLFKLNNNFFCSGFLPYFCNNSKF